jgi:plastocyanin
MALSATSAGSLTTPTIDAENLGAGIYGETHRWQPAQVTIPAGGQVTLVNPTKLAHGVEWRSAVKPSCEEGAGKVPVGSTPVASGVSWSGNCTFSQPGSYTFYCTVHGPEMTGTVTVPGTPEANTEAAAAITQTTATLAGVVNPQGETMQYYFEYGIASVSEHTTAVTSLGASDFSGHHLAVPIAGLAAGSEYHAQLVAIYGVAKTMALGGEQAFTTLAPAAPTATTSAASAIGETAATLTGTVDPNGGGATEYHFEYGISTSYEHSTPVVGGLPADGLSHQVSAMLAGLAPGTTYHFRLVASNELGPASGEDLTFKTVSQALPPGEQPQSQPLTTATSSLLPGASPTPSRSAAPMAGVAAHGLRLLDGHGGMSVRGALTVSTAAAGGQLEVQVLLRRGSRLVRVGRLHRSQLRPGALDFSVRLNAYAAQSLRTHHRFAVTVRLVVRPRQGAALTITRVVVLRR